MEKLVGYSILLILIISIITPLNIASSSLINTSTSSIVPRYSDEVREMLLKVFDENPLDTARSKLVDGYGFTIIDNNVDKGVYREFMVIIDKNMVRTLSRNVERIKFKIPIDDNHVLAFITCSRDQLLNILSLDIVHNIAPSPSIEQLFSRDKREVLMNDERSVEIHNPRDLDDSTPYGTFGSRDVMGINQAYREYGVTGENIVVGMVDTGVDFSSPELGLDALAYSEDGSPLTVVVDEHLALTPLDVVADENGVLNTSDVAFPVYSTFYSGYYGEPTWYLITLHVNFTVSPEIMSMSQSGVFKFGMLEYFFADSLTGYYIMVPVPVLLIDSAEPGVYDTAVFDLSTAFYILSSNMVSLEESLYGTHYWREPESSWLDYSFADEPLIHYGGGELIARDFDGDGIYDFSLGTLVGTYIDSYGLADYYWSKEEPGNLYLGEPGQRTGLDPNGKYVAVFTDYMGHGTSVATIIGARGNLVYNGYGNNPYIYLGVAPAAKIAAGTGFWFGDLMAAEFWLGGWDIYPSPYGGFDIAPAYKRADVISNSWSYINVIKWAHQAPGLDYISAAFNQLIVYDMLMDWNVSIVFAAGNYGPGYSSMGSPSGELLTITVGASTLFEYYQIYGYPPGYADDIALFSSRGPNGLGYPKPDVVAVGAYEWAGVRTIDGRGFGATGYFEPPIGPGLTLFSGTSEATPFVSGVIALGLEAYLWRYGYYPSPIDLKILLKSSCDDLNYPALIQGSGRVNAYKLVKTILEDDFVAYIPEGIRNAFLETYGSMYQMMFGEDYDLFMDYMMSILGDTAYYNVLKPGGMDTFSLVVKGSGVVNARAYTYILAKQYLLYSGVYNLRTSIAFMIPRSVFKDYDYMEIYVLYKNVSSTFNITPISRDYLIRIDVFDQYLGKRYRLNTEARYSTTALLTIGNLRNRVRGDLYLRLRNNPYLTQPKYVSVEVWVRIYKLVPFSWIQFSGVPRYVDGETTISCQVNVPASAKPGVYEYKIIVETPFKTISIPGTILVPAVIDSSKWSVQLYLTKSPSTYDSYTPLGTIDPYTGTRTEALDWRMIPIIIEDKSVAGLIMFAKWSSGSSTSLEAVVMGPGGAYDISTEYPNVFAAYKLVSNNGYVYNPSISDQLSGLLKLYIPVKWSLGLRSFEAWYMRSYGRYSYVDYAKSYSYQGLYRLYIAYGSYSGSRLFDTVKILLSVVRTYQTWEPSPDEDTIITVTAVFATAPYYQPFKNSAIVSLTDYNVYNPWLQPIVYGYYRYGSTYNPIYTVYGWQLGTTSAGYYVSVTYDTGMPGSMVETALILKDIAWHASGIIYLEDNVPVVEDVYYPGVVSAISSMLYPDGF